MKNGMDSVFNLGAYRRCLCYCFAVVALSSSAEFTDSDSQVLSTINARVYNLFAIRDALLPNGNIGSDLEEIRQYQLTINNQIISINDYVSGINRVISSIHFTNDSVDVQDTRLRDTVEQSNSELQSLNRKFDTFLDYYSNNLQNASTFAPWVYTNLAYGIDFFMDLYPEVNQETASGNQLLWLYRVLTGNYEASFHEAEIFWQYYRGTSPSRWHIFDVLSHIYYQALPSDLATENDVIYNALFPSKGGLYRDLINYVDDLSEEYYYEYGTRELTATNQVILEAVRALTNGLFSGSLSSSAYELSEHDTNSVYSSGFRNVVTGLAGSIRPSVESDIQNVNTNDIENIENTQYSSFIRTMASPDDEMVSGFEDEIRRFASDLSGQIDNFQQVQELTVDFGTFSLFDVSQPISFKIARPGAMYWNVIHYCATFLRVAICAWWAIAIWSFVSSSKTQGALE